ncbi:hypothetical protein ACE4Z6_26865 [Salmonella enterica]|uniref:hypothetical protein n=1 Tax=Salmonella enterica TaxID=28901 RepID=UPI003D2DB372
MKKHTKIIFSTALLGAVIGISVLLNRKSIDEILEDLDQLTFGCGVCSCDLD